METCAGNPQRSTSSAMNVANGGSGGRCSSYSSNKMSRISRRSARMAASTADKDAAAPAGSAKIRARSDWSSSTALVTVWVRPSWIRIAHRARSSSTRASTVWSTVFGACADRTEALVALKCFHPFGRGRWF